ncbi:MAG TPA: dTDP-glucose 4,6-dehydratase [Alphaproteobacteria bacterium]|nr:dTDP-glucose 4,6-dehydratase [Alphaproteobacteria bacterium]
MQKILVTGGAGFIGSNFIRYWLNKYPTDQIINFDKLTYAGHLESLKDIDSNPNYEFVQGDICDPQAVQNVMKDVDIVVHFAAESHVDRSIKDPSIFIKTNVLGTQVLLDAALTNKVKRFHHISTDEVFGALELGGGKFNETTCYDPHSPYSASKAGSDHLVRAYKDTYDLPITITNCANNFGPYHDPEKLFPRSITNLIDKKPTQIYGDGKYVRDWLYVEDHCEAIDLVITKGEIGETYLVGSMIDEINNLEIAKKLLKIFNLNESYIEFVKDRPGHDRRYAIDSTKIRNLGWEPKHDFDTWLVKTVDWYKNNEWWWRPLKQKAEKLYE